MHLSDLHLTAQVDSWFLQLGLYEVCDEDILRVLSETIYDWRDELDAVLISGDIATTGRDIDLSFAINLFSSTAQSGNLRKDFQSHYKFDDFGKPIIIVPGNHDRFRSIFALPGGFSFDRYFEKYWNCGNKRVQAHLLPNDIEPRLAIICADFSLKSVQHITTPTGHPGQGKVDDTILQYLIDKTKEISDSFAECAFIWMIHFAPNCEGHFEIGKNHSLIDYNKLIEAAMDTNVKHIFCGHTHMSEIYSEGNGRVNIFCAGTSACLPGTEKQDKRDPKIHVRDIEIDNGKIIEIRSLDIPWDKDLRNFQVS
ncbi:MAG: metallophosphoesterase [Candidatus Magnetominusculus sp. LBB02]|nr:metallophosphoesterase [Candidatus Magnetominusculus sp. LBB02]